MLTGGIADDRFGGEALGIRGDALRISKGIRRRCGREKTQDVTLAGGELAARLENELEANASVLGRRRLAA